jgi:hypothetical protein
MGARAEYASNVLLRQMRYARSILSNGLSAATLRAKNLQVTLAFPFRSTFAK